jgi:hypothetical protein
MRGLIDAALPGARLGAPATETMIRDAEARVGARFQPWLSEVYLAANGVRTCYGTAYLWPLDGRDGTVEMTLFLRNEDWAPAWLSAAIVIGSTDSSGSSTTHWVCVDNQLASWCYSDRGVFVGRTEGLTEAWRRDSSQADEADGSNSNA